MKRFLILLLLPAAMVLLGCDGREGVATTVTAVPTPTATALPLTPTATPPPSPAPAADDEPRRTGDPELDAIIAAVELRDIASLADFVAHQEIGCTHADGLGGPPKCAPGQEEGAIERVFPFAACEGEWTRTPVTVLGQFVHRAQGVRLALEVTKYPAGVEWPQPDALIVFHSSTPAGDYLEISDGRITRLATVCAGELDDFLGIDVYGFEFIAGPWDEPRSPADVASPSTGIAAVDTVLDQVARYDWPALRENAVQTMQSGVMVNCVAEVEGPGDVACDPKNDDRPGDLVHVFPMAFCEGALTYDPGPSLMGFLNEAPRLHSVLRAPREESPSQLYRHGAYWLLYEFTSAQSASYGVEGARLHLTEDGGIAVMWYGCIPSIEELGTHDGEPLEVLLDARE